MAASADDLITKVGYATATTLSAPGYTSGVSTSITVGSTSTWPTDTGVIFAIDEAEVVDGEEVRIDGTYNVFEGKVQNGTTINNVDYIGGDTERSYSAGALTRVYMLPASYLWNRLISALMAEHSQLDGSHTDVTADSVTSASFTVTGQTTAMLANVKRYTYDGTDIFIDGVDQNNGANTTTWTKPTNLKYVIVEVQGGGGGGGGAATASAGQSAVGRGGGGGGYSRKKIAAASLGSTETITVGAAGSAGSAGNNSGGNGGNSSFGTHAVGNGGSLGAGGSSSTVVSNVAGGAGGTATSGDVNIDGQAGASGGRSSATNVTSGQGGDSVLGHGGAQNTAFGSSGSNAGNAATGFGAGGGGAVTSDGGTQKAGAAGGGGIVIVSEYF